jgi:hypothetical protein
MIYQYVGALVPVAVGLTVLVDKHLLVSTNPNDK